MIIDTLNNLLEDPTQSTKIQSAVKFLSETDFSGLTLGQHIIDEDTFFFLSEYETKDVNDCFWESHIKNLDLHYILEGTEKVGYELIDRLSMKEPYNQEKDAIFFTGEVNSAVTLNQGDVLVCFPQDGHMTGISGIEKTKVRKVILKVKI
jgi:YhcH/YjgK/YiaL family protein